MVADVGPNRHSDATLGRDEIAKFVKLCARTGGQHHRRACSGKCKGDFATDTPSGAGHDRDLILKCRTHRAQPYTWQPAWSGRRVRLSAELISQNGKCEFHDSVFI